NGSSSALTAADRDKLGYVKNAVAVGRMMNGDWAAIFGNGLDSPDGKAYLMVVNLSTGALIRAIPTNATTGNGLGGASLIYNKERVVVGAYAGDSLGNLWRFDLEAASPASWKAGLGGTALFTTSPARPIMAAPT